MNITDRLVRNTINLLCFIVLCYIIFQMILRPSEMRSGIAQILGVSVSPYNVYFLGGTKNYELATFVHPVLVQYMGSKGEWPVDSRLTLQGHYEMKIGFDINPNQAIDVDRFNLKTTVSIPPPKVLSIELKNYKVLEDNQSIWTAFTPEEQAKALMGMQEYARNSAESGGIVDSAVESLKERLERYTESYGGNIEVIVAQPVAELR